MNFLPFTFWERNSIIGLQFGNNQLHAYDVEVTRSSSADRLRNVTEELALKSSLVDCHYIVWVYARDGVLPERGRALASVRLPPNAIIIYGHLEYIPVARYSEPDGEFVSDQRDDLEQRLRLDGFNNQIRTIARIELEGQPSRLTAPRPIR